MNIFGKAPGQEYRKFGEQTFQREDYSKSRQEMVELAYDLKQGWFNTIENYRIVKEEGYYILYVR